MENNRDEAQSATGMSEFGWTLSGQSMNQQGQTSMITPAEMQAAQAQTQTPEPTVVPVEPSGMLMPQQQMIQNQTQSQSQMQTVPVGAARANEISGKRRLPMKGIMIAIGVGLMIIAGVVGFLVLGRPDYKKQAVEIWQALMSAPVVSVNGRTVITNKKGGKMFGNYPIKAVELTNRINLQFLPDTVDTEMVVRFTDNTVYKMEVAVLLTEQNEVFVKLKNLSEFLLVLTKVKVPKMPKLNVVTLRPFVEMAKRYQNQWIKISQDGSVGTWKDNVVCELKAWHNLGERREEMKQSFAENNFLRLSKIEKQKDDRSKKVVKKGKTEQKIEMLQLAIGNTEWRNFWAGRVEKTKQCGVMIPLEELIKVEKNAKRLIGVEKKTNKIANWMSEGESDEYQVQHIYEVKYADQKKAATVPEKNVRIEKVIEDFEQALAKYQKLQQKQPEESGGSESLDEHCSYYQGNDPSDRCYKRGCAATLEGNKNPECLPKKFN